MAGESSSSGLRSVRGGVTPRTGFRGIYQDWVMLHMWFLFGQDAPQTGLNLGLAHCFWTGPHSSYIFLSEVYILLILNKY